jgi:hypothetical protein
MNYWKPYQNIKKIKYSWSLLVVRSSITNWDIFYCSIFNKIVSIHSTNECPMWLPSDDHTIDMPKFGNVKGNAIIHLILDVKFPTPTPKKMKANNCTIRIYMLYLDKRFNMTINYFLMGNSIYLKPWTLKF